MIAYRVATTNTLGLDGEIWLPVRGFEDHYAVSNLGRVKRTAPSTNSKIGQILKPRCGLKRGTAYPSIGLYVNDRCTSKRIHVVVFEAFHGPVPPGMEINHKDGDKWNNRADNLEPNTHLANVQHAIATGLFDQRGSKNHQAKVDDLIVKKILAIHSTGRCGAIRLGKFTGLSEATIRGIVRGENWSHIDRSAIKPDYLAAAELVKQYPAPFGPRSPRNPKRSRLYLKWIRTNPCTICDAPGSDAHHTGSHGLSVKSSDFLTIPLCRSHHREYHKIGRVKFESLHKFSILAVIEGLQALAVAEGIQLYPERD